MCIIMMMMMMYWIVSNAQPKSCCCRFELTCALMLSACSETCTHQTQRHPSSVDSGLNGEWRTPTKTYGARENERKIDIFHWLLCQLRQ